MKNLLMICGVSLLLGMIALTGGQNRGGNEHIKDRFAGAWRLAWLEQPGFHGRPHKVDCSGLLAYTRDGNVSVQVMERNPETHVSADPQQYSQGGTRPHR